MKFIKLLSPILSKMPDSFIKYTGNKVTDVILKKYAAIEINGKEILDSRMGKPTIYISNHLSNVDGIILNKILSKNSIIFMAGVKLGDNPLTSFFLRTVDYIPVVPNSADRNAIKLAIKALKENKSILIFPEGTRSRTGSLIKAKKGFILLAKMANVPIVPIALEGTELLLPINDTDMGSEKLRKANIKIQIGEPMMLPDKNDFEDSESWENECTNLTMHKIANMLQPKYQGVYKIEKP